MKRKVKVSFNVEGNATIDDTKDSLIVTFNHNDLKARFTKDQLISILMRSRGFSRGGYRK